MNRNNLRSAAVALAMVSLTGTFACKDFLDVEPISSTDTSFVFSSVSGATSAVIGAYDPLSGDSGYGQRLSSYYQVDTDDMRCSGEVDNGRRGIARYALTPGNTELLGPWNTLYTGVERANVCIRNIRDSELFKNGSAADKAAMGRLLGESLTLRAQYMYELIRNWGDVPAPRLPAAATADLKVSNEDRDMTYDLLLEDLREAADLVPWRSALGSGDERMTKGAVKALRARIALARGGFALRSDGQVRRGSNYQQYYTIARQECSEIMQSGQHALNPNFEALFRGLNELRIDNSEVLFEVAMAGGSAASDSKLGYYTGPRLDNGSRYGGSNPGLNVLPNYLYAFDSLDTRRDVSVTYYSVNAASRQQPVVLNVLTDGKFRRDWRAPLLTGSSQYLGINWPIIRYADVLLMFAEAQNELADPSTPFNGKTAVQALEDVRRRAFRGNTGRIGTTPTTKTAFFDALVNERYLEFGGEGVRKFDLIRWNMLGEKLSQARAEITSLRDRTGRYANYPTVLYWRQNGDLFQLYSPSANSSALYRPAPASAPAGYTSSVNWTSGIGATYSTAVGESFITGKSELLPIPQVAIDTNPNLRQNPKY
ncbi:RagB/SusD family nutrient uptake outer membrane protein [Hymenobacter jeollabukensis]|uniref:RagB/SusD family nutrient uptake outer membrane protein n=1 Tax=Hymenobacter jeollabukensis TaxID=2025313 RepID=A0A5R8WRL6_9BACT|nr:RagB/SusD family nutrient uptake outer membrane protein [Hymenobacter jeollabukensis]TLM93062.1 RagB/SusD family nutrient uptake outer membrane protein [Hymenobacter jeollabukensis]